MSEANRFNSTTSAESANTSPRPHHAPRTTTFDRAWQKIEAKAVGTGSPWTPRNAARLYLLTERASGDAKNDDALREIGDMSTTRLERIAATRSRDFGDVAAKLAALIVENGQNDPVQSGGIEGAIHAGMCSCLADLVILGDAPLPDVSAVLDMRAPDFELRDATEEEIAEFWARAQADKPAQPAPVLADQSAKVAPHDDGRERDSFGRITVEGERLQHALAGWHETLWALRDLARKRALSPHVFDPLLTEIGTMQDELEPIDHPATES